jgi:tetratricopeptide (TPR) repeat protein
MGLKYSRLNRYGFWIFSLVALNSYAQTESPHPGPRSEAEATLLYQEGTDALIAKKYADASRSLERFVARYPSNEKIQDAYLSLLDALFNEKKYDETLRYVKELMSLKAPEEKSNRARQFQAEADLNLHEYLDARIVSDELLKNHPTERQRATAYSIKFQSFLEEKQYVEARNQLDALDVMMEKAPLDPFIRLMPEFKMTIAIRECTISHLLKHKEFEETELTDYFTSKNLCFKSALPNAVNGMGDSAIQEWCESYTYLNHELESMKLDPFLKEKLNKDLKATFEFSKTLSPGFAKCYEPYKPPKPAKSKKRHRKRRVHAS